MEQKETYLIETVDDRYHVVGYNHLQRVKTIYAICRTKEQAEIELEQVKQGTHSTQTNPGGTL